MNHIALKWFRFAARNVVRNRRRAAFTALLTAIGSFALLAAGGFAQYTYDALRESSANDTGHLILAGPRYFDEEEERPLAHGLAMTPALTQQLAGDARVRRVVPHIQFSGLISNGEKSAVFFGTGVVPKDEFEIKAGTLNIVDGHVLSDPPPRGADPEIMLGRDLARELKAEVGRSLTLLSTTADGGLNAQDVRVAGVFSTGIPELDKRLLLTGLGTVQALLRTDRVSSLAVYLHHTDDTAAVREALGRDLPGYALRPWWMEAHFYSSVRALYERIFGVLGVIVALMVFFSVANTMGMTVIERTREIGALRALGAAPGDIVRNFTLEALVIGVGGALIGVLLAAGLSSLLAIANIQMPPPPGRSSGYPLLVHILPGQYVIRTVTVAALCIVAAWLASHRAARKPIVEALAHV